MDGVWVGKGSFGKLGNDVAAVLTTLYSDEFKEMYILYVIQDVVGAHCL